MHSTLTLWQQECSWTTVSRHAPAVRLGCISDKTLSLAGLCGSVYSFTPSLLPGTLSFPIPFSTGKKKNWARKASNEKRGVRKDSGENIHYGSKTTYHLCSSLSSFLHQDAAPFTPTLVSFPALQPQQPQSLESIILSVPVFSIASWYPHSSFHFTYLSITTFLPLFNREYHSRDLFSSGVISVPSPALGVNNFQELEREEAVLTV